MGSSEINYEEPTAESRLGTHEIHEDQVKKNHDEQRDSQIRKAVIKLFGSDEGKGINDEITSEAETDGSLIVKILDLCEIVRNILAKEQGYQNIEGKYFDSRGVDFTENMKRDYPDKAISSLLAEHFASAEEEFPGQYSRLLSLAEKSST